MAERIGIAVVGTGDWGANLVRNFASLPGARLVALCDATRSGWRRPRPSTPARAPSPTSTRSPRDPDVQGVVVAASAVSHYPLAKALLEAGKDVYVEKPLTLEVAARRGAGAARARAAAASSWSATCCCYHPAVRYLKEHGRRAASWATCYYIYSQRVNLGQGAQGRERAVELRARTTCR